MVSSSPALVLVPSSPLDPTWSHRSPSSTSLSSQSKSSSSKNNSPVSFSSRGASSNGYATPTTTSTPPSSYGGPTDTDKDSISGSGTGGGGGGGGGGRSSSESAIFSIYSMYGERRQTWRKSAFLTNGLGHGNHNYNHSRRSAEGNEIKGKESRASVNVSIRNDSDDDGLQNESVESSASKFFAFAGSGSGLLDSGDGHGISSRRQSQPQSRRQSYSYTENASASSRPASRHVGAAGTPQNININGSGTASASYPAAYAGTELNPELAYDDVYPVLTSTPYDDEAYAYSADGAGARRHRQLQQLIDASSTGRTGEHVDLVSEHEQGQPRASPDDINFNMNGNNKSARRASPPSEGRHGKSESTSTTTHREYGIAISPSDTNHGHGGIDSMSSTCSTTQEGYVTAPQSMESGIAAAYTSKKTNPAPALAVMTASTVAVGAPCILQLNGNSLTLSSQLQSPTQTRTPTCTPTVQRFRVMNPDPCRSPSPGPSSTTPTPPPQSYANQRDVSSQKGSPNASPNGSANDLLPTSVPDPPPPPLPPHTPPSESQTSSPGQQQQQQRRQSSVSSVSSSSPSRSPIRGTTTATSSSSHTSAHRSNTASTTTSSVSSSQRSHVAGAPAGAVASSSSSSSPSGDPHPPSQSPQASAPSSPSTPKGKDQSSASSPKPDASTRGEGEESESFFVRNTYAQLDVTGVKGDGYEEGVERTRAKLGHNRRSVQLAAVRGEAREDGGQVSGDVADEELELLSNVDRYGFFTTPSHDRTVMLTGSQLSKSLHPITSAYTSGPPSPPTLSSPPKPKPVSKDLESKRISKWGRMLEAEQRDCGGNVAIWRVRASKERKLRSRLFKGIPDAWRAAAWEVLVGRFVSRKKKKSLDARSLESMLNDLRREYRSSLDRPSSYDVQIDLDVPRTISGHVMFKTRYGQGQRSLFHTLHSFSLVCKECGYCQGMGPLAATLLCYYEPEKVYSFLVHFHDEYEMHDIFLPGFPGLLEAIYVQERIMQRMLPAVYASFKRHMISTTSYATKWYITCFANTVPFQTQLRLWDAFLLEGRDVFVVVAVAIVWVLRDHLTSAQATFESVLSLLSSFFVPEDEDALMKWVDKALDDKKLRADMGRWRTEWRGLVKEKKEGGVLLGM